MRSTQRLVSFRAKVRNYLNLSFGFGGSLLELFKPTLAVFEVADDLLFVNNSDTF